jgi:hypothetical protein
MELVPSYQDGEEGFRPILGKGSGAAAADGWAQCGPGSFTVADGVATGEGGMGLWWFKKELLGNFVLRGEFLQEVEKADSGIFVRFPNPGADPWNAVRQGHEMEIETRCPRSRRGEPAQSTPSRQRSLEALGRQDSGTITRSFASATITRCA